MNRSPKKHGRSCAITARMIVRQFVPLIACILAQLPCARASADAPVTLRFHADRQTAGVGETVHWTVWVEFPEDTPADTDLIALAGTFRARHPMIAIAGQPTALTLGERYRPVPIGASIEHMLIAPDRVPTGLPRRIPIYAFSTLVVNTQQPLWYDTDATILTADPAGYTFHRRENGRTRIGRPMRIVSDIVNLPGCNEADLAPPYGQLDVQDIVSYIQLFISGAPIADLARPYGIIDVADLSRFMQLYFIGCHDSVER